MWMLRSLVGSLLLCAAGVGLAAEAPSAVSPGDASGRAFVEARCPTFSWGAVDGAKRYELVVYRLGAEGDEAEPVLDRQIAGSALSWTPSLHHCLERGGRYAWSVRGVGEEAASDWSVPSVFQVVSGPSVAEFEEALAVVRTYLGARGEAAPETEPEKAAVSRDKNTRASAEAPAPLAPPGTQMSVDGNVDAVSFSGSGAMLTNLLPANLSAGTAAIDISGNAATATTATTASDLVCTDCIGTTEIDRNGFDADLLDGLDSSALAPISHEHLHQVWAGGPDDGLQIDIFTPGAAKSALWGRMVHNAGGADSAAVRGENLSLNGEGYGVLGAHAGNGVGVQGTSQNFGVLGRAGNIGVFGDATIVGGAGVWGSATATNGVNFGVYGRTSSSSGWAGYFAGRTHVAGLLGIGTLSPAWPLSVRADQAVAQLESTLGTNGSVLELRSTVASPTFLGAINFNNAANTTPGQIAYRGDNTMTFRTNGFERMRVTGVGQVGINTNSPQAELHVNGRARFESEVGILGAVGIGTLSPSAMLDVNGSIAIAPTQRWISIPAPSFNFTWGGISGETSINRGSTYFALKSHGIDPGLVTVQPEYANAPLPDGAKIRELKLRADGSNVTLSLVRIHIDLNTVETLAQLTSSGTGGNTTSTTAIAAGMEVVDNSTYAYVLVAQDPRDTSPNETLLRAVRVRYEITSPLP